MTQTPSIGRIVHYHSYGTPGGEFLPEPRAAVITEIVEASERVHAPVVSLAVLNPTGMFFNRDVHHHDGRETPGAADCPNKAGHGAPFRYCACGWIEASYKGGTWHWLESAEAVSTDG